MYDESLQILKHYWGYNSFRKPQQEIITEVLAGNNVVSLLPTGGGKSICFQVPALVKKGVCIVVSPLISLMQDQVSNLVDKGIKATLIPSGSTQDEIITLFDNIRFGNTKFLYISPERLQSRFIQEKIKQLNVNLIAIDEAHCISEWGHDFRPSYQNITILKELQPTSPIIALTATATQKVISDIISSLELEKPIVFKKSFFRENLAYQIFKTEDKLGKLNQIFIKTKAPAIVYVNTRSKTKEISSYLNAQGYKSSFYHGGLSSVEKKIAFDNWMSEKTPIIVATNAFGMGIDKPNVR
ncbi:RecQ family ATP-dependent DNA helicase, partial [Rhodobacteraceae bacterium 4F10]